MAPPIAVTVVTGFLGAGKTTLIRRWLAARPGNERWAVLVNEFGALGVDAALLAAPAVFEVAGGCACCAAQAGARAALMRLLRAGPWQRLLIELSGLGHPGPFIDLLRQPPFDRLLRIEQVVAVVDAARPAPFAAGHLHELARAQIEAADCVVINRGASLPAAELTALAQRLAALPPFERAVVVDGADEVPDVGVLFGAGHASGGAGTLPAVGLSASSGSSASSAPALAPAPIAQRVFVPSLGAWRLQQRSAGLHSLGWRWPPTVLFDRRRLQAALAGEWLVAAPLLRAKGVFRTGRDWYAWQFGGNADGHDSDQDIERAWQPSGYRRDSRVEILLDYGEAGDAAEFLTAIQVRLQRALAAAPGRENG